MAEEPRRIDSLSKLMLPDALNLLAANGNELVKQIGIDIVRAVVFDVLTGKNLRSSTEVLTRRRIAALNLATIHLFLKGATQSADFVERLPSLATDILAQPRLSKADRWLAQWVLGLTDKAFQNVLRDDPASLTEYRDRYVEACHHVVADYTERHGRLSGALELASGVKAEINWLFMTYLLNTIGAQTLAIRGSEKAAYGKLFEKLILGSLLHILGFEYVPSGNPETPNRVFWLSSQRQERRESDATVLFEAGKGVRFDIGFIGRGNPEISLDKVARFERELSLGRSRWYMATIIIVDRIGRGSRIQELAQDIGGTIIQMSAGYWPQRVARELQRIMGYEHDLVTLEQEHIEDFIRRELARVPLESFINPSRQRD